MKKNLFVRVLKKLNSTIGMAKIQIKFEIFMSFSGIFLIMG